MSFIQFFDSVKNEEIGAMISAYTCKPEIYLRVNDKDNEIEIDLSYKDIEQLHSYLGTFLKQNNEPFKQLNL